VFSPLAVHEAEALNMPDLPFVVVPHPVATRTDAELREIAAGLVPAVLRALCVRGEAAVPSAGRVKEA
jgi:hypothetical protein